MAQYRKKPVVIKAFHWTEGINKSGTPEWLFDAIRKGSVRFENAGTLDVAMLIETLKGTHRAKLGDWIIRSVNGELHSCKPDIFEMTYEAD